MNINHTVRLVLAGSLFAPALFATDIRPMNAAATGTKPPTAAVRGREWVGEQVYSADGFPIGDAIDCVLQFDQSPQLRYVIVKSGGLLGLHADERAIPADAITLTGHRFHVALTRVAFEQLPVLTANHRLFLSFPDNRAELARLCQTPPGHANLRDDYVLYSDLYMRRVVAGQDDQPLGIYSDLWVDFNANEAPFLEFYPTTPALADTGSARFELPTTKLTSFHANRLRFAVNEDQVARSRVIDNVCAYVAAAGEKLEMHPDRALR
jgi:PRC-barrel domain